MAGRRFGIYFAWSRPEEIGAEMGVLENRYPALYEFRRAHWPDIEPLKNPPYKQDISGFLDHIILHDFELFAKVVREASGNQVKIIQRVNQPPTQELDRDFLKDFDTLIVVSLDHFRTNQNATQGEIDCVKDFLSREDRCVFICPHHDIGSTGVLADQTEEWKHHLDRTIPGQQRIGGFARSLLTGLGFDVLNRWGLNPLAAPDERGSLLIKYPDLDAGALLDGVRTFNLHPHLPHFEVARSPGVEIDVLAEQLINPHAQPHPLVEPRERKSFNALLALRAPQRWPGRIYVGDATLWSAAFEGLESLKRLWINLAAMR